MIRATNHFNSGRRCLPAFGGGFTRPDRRAFHFQCLFCFHLNSIEIVAQKPPARSLPGFRTVPRLRSRLLESSLQARRCEIQEWWAGSFLKCGTGKRPVYKRPSLSLNGTLLAGNRTAERVACLGLRVSHGVWIARCPAGGASAVKHTVSAPGYFLFSIQRKVTDAQY